MTPECFLEQVTNGNAPEMKPNTCIQCGECNVTIQVEEGPQGQLSPRVDMAAVNCESSDFRA